MKKTNFIFIFALIASMLFGATASQAQPVIDSVRFTYVSGTAGLCTTYFHDTGTHTVVSSVRTCHNSSFTGAYVSYTSDTTVVVHGYKAITRNVYCADPLVNYAQAIWDTLGGTPDTTNPPQIMWRMSSFGPITVVKSDTALFYTYSFDPGNRPATLVGVTSTDAGFTFTSPLNSRTITGIGSVVYHDTARYLSDNTPYWVRLTGTTGMGTAIVIHADTTLPHMPTGSDTGAVSVTMTSLTRHTKVKTYSVAGTATDYLYSSGVLHDSVVVALTATPAWQYPDFAHTGLALATTYVHKTKLVTPGGVVWISPNDTVTTLSGAPTGADSGAVTVTTSTINRHIKAQTLGYAGTATSYAYQGGILVDTVVQPLLATTLWQYLSFLHDTLSGGTNYVIKTKLVTSGGTFWLTNDTITTLPVVLAHVFYDSAMYVSQGGSAGFIKAYIHDTSATVHRYRFQTNSNSTFTGFSSWSSWDTVATFTGTHLDTASVINPDTTASYGRLIWNTIGSTHYDTSAGVLMLRKPTIMDAVTPDLHTFYSTLTVNPGNTTVTVSGVIYNDTTYGSVSPIHTYTVSGSIPVAIHDTVPYTLPSYTTHPMVWTVTSPAGVKIDTVVSTTLITVTYPYVADYGVPTIGWATATRHIKCDVYGSPGSYARCYLYYLGTLIDSVNVPLAPIVGVQYIDFPFAGLSSLTAYTWTVIVHNSAGTTPLSTLGFTTDPMPTTLTAMNAGSAMTSHTRIHAVMLYTTRPGHPCDMTICIRKVGTTVPVDTLITGLSMPTGMADYTATIYTPGTYVTYGWVHDDSLIKLTDTVSITVVAASNTLTTSADSVYIGDSVDVNYMALNSDTSTLSSTAGMSTPVTSTGTVRVRIDTTTTFTFVSNGITTATATKTVYAKARPIVDTTDSVDHTGVNLLIAENSVHMYPNPSANQITVSMTAYNNISLDVYDIAGRPYSSSTATSTETNIFVANFPNGLYLLRLVQNGKVFKEFKFIVQH